MKRSIVLASAAAVVTSAAPHFYSAPVGEAIDGEFIVRVHEPLNASQLRSHVSELKEKLGKDIDVVSVFPGLANVGFSAFACKLSPVGLEILKKSDAYSYIEQNKVVSVSDCKTESDAEWGLRRTNIRGSYTAGDYSYTTGATGKGVDAYIIDTGIYCENNDFVNKQTGTCTYGADFVDGSNVDGNGHGTHCAGTVAGQTYGVAKEANLIAVRVLNDKGSGTLQAIIDGVAWVIDNYQKTNTPSVANLSLGSSYSQSVNDAVESAVDAGINMMVAAGNDNRNACNYSPASAAKAVTVGATDISDKRASYSNYGKCLDLFGPGTDITSAWIGSPNATKTISGTSMATPHVTGVGAKYLSANPSLSTSQVTAKLVSDATQGVVINADGGLIPNTDNKSPNLIVYGYCS